MDVRNLLIAIAFIFSVARIVTGGHWPSDVLGGLLLAGGWMTTLLSIRFIGDRVIRWPGEPEAAWAARYPNLPHTWEARRGVVRRNLWHLVPMHLRWLEGWKSASWQKQSSYEAARSKARMYGVLPAELPEGYTWVEEHTWGYWE
jgi:hypothetical protein